jgi:WD40 repeat protein
MGVVYRARQDKLNRLVALKLIRSGSLAGAEDIRRFRQEAEAIAELDHPHIIPIYEIGQEDDQPYFSMKLIDRGNLKWHIPRLKDDPSAVVALMAKVARAVHYAHQRTILHRDIKPSNILLDDHDEPYVTDFGLAKRIGPDRGTAATVTGMVMGTPSYMPPEQARGGTKSVTTAADVYGLGATLYETLTGQPPFAGDSAEEVMRQVLNQEPARPRSVNPKLDRDLETICLKCLAKEPARRYGSAEAVAEDLERWGTGMPIMARPVPVWEKVVKWVKRRPERAALVLVVHIALLGLFGGGVWFTLQLRQERDMANRGRYAADMNLARRALDDGLIYQIREQLKAYRANPSALGDLRSFEWYYLANLCDQTPIRLRGHQKTVICLAFHPDGNRVVSGGADGSVRVWDLSSRRAIHVFPGRGDSVHCVAVSPDGRWLATGDAGGDLRLWELDTGRLRALPGHESGLRSVAFSPDSRHLLSADAGGLVVQSDVLTGIREFELRHRHDEDVATSETIGTNSRELGHGTISAFTPDGRTIISVGTDEWVMIWDVATRRLRDQIRCGSDIHGLSISPDGRHLALAQQSAATEILDLERPHDPHSTVRGSFQHVGSVAFSPNRLTLAIAGLGGGVRLLDARSTQILDLFGDQVNMSPLSLAFGAGGRFLAMAVRDEIRVLRVARSHNGSTVAAGLGSIRRLAASPDERLLALGRDDGTIVVWDLRAERVLQTLSGHGLAVFGVAFLPGPGGVRLVSVGGDGLMKVWDPEAGGQPLHTLTGHSGAVYSVAVRPDGRQIATGGEDGFVRTWDPATGRADLPPLDHGAAISALAYAPTGTALASGGTDRTIRIWSATSAPRRLRTLAHPHQVTCLSFSPDGRLLAAGGGAIDKGGRVLIWDASSGAISTTVECPRGVDFLSFSPDSRRVATCGADSVVQVWDATGGHETLSLQGHRDRVTAVLFEPSALRLYSAGRDGVVKLWDGTPAAPAE